MHSTFGHSPKNMRRKMVSLIAATGIAFGSVIAPQSAVAVETCAATTTEIPRAITNVHILADGKETDTFTKGQSVDIKFDWTSAGTTLKTGSFFTIQVPQEYFSAGQNAVPTFPILAEGSSEVIGCGSYGSDGTLTVVFNEKVEGLQNPRGWVSVGAIVSGKETEADKPSKVTFKDVKSIDINIKPSVGAADWIFRKDGWLTLPTDHPFFSLQKMLSWRVNVPAYDKELHNLVITDDSADPKWYFNCDSTKGNLKMTDGLNGSEIKDIPWTLECEKEKVTIKVPTVPANRNIVFGNMIGAADKLVNGTYTNTANGVADEIKTISTNQKSVDVRAAGAADADTPTTPPTKPSDPSTPPTKPSEPSTPPTKPSEPSTPPTKPSDPSTPPTKPSDPSTPPTKPSDPSTPPTKPSEPSTPPTKPSDPSTPPTKPSKPSEPSTPPTKPSEPTPPPTTPPSSSEIPWWLILIPFVPLIPLIMGGGSSTPKVGPSTPAQPTQPTPVKGLPKTTTEAPAAPVKGIEKSNPAPAATQAPAQAPRKQLAATGANTAGLMFVAALLGLAGAALIRRKKA
ncbi:Ig-like domain-containing protein [Corynebacterium argentoratense]|uniref:Ig-like domain-containing protein n=1 Tax=Corynebacterium argentoratense TaxID=42817 RepID=UPI002E1F807D